jgi:tetratricopeptide (TPR) repeat protein
VLDLQAAAFPWEMLVDPRSKKGTPLAVEHGLVRRLIIDNPLRAAEGAEEDVALVIGNPKLNHPLFPDLPSATREAVAVAQVLQDEAGFRVVASIDNHQKAVVRAAFGHRDGAHGYRILHLAGHGVYSETGRSGMLIGPDAVLGANEIHCMPTVPEFVFINCCHLGRTDGVLGALQTPEANRLAANLGVAFIERGARAVIAAGWAVNDLAARMFAEEVYRQLLVKREYFGEAVRMAREMVYREFGSRSNTWGAYHCYGDHSFRLRTPKEPQSARSADPPLWISPRRVVQDLFNLAQRADTARGGTSDLLERVDAIEQVLQEPEKKPEKIYPKYYRTWYDSEASIRAHLGMAYGNLGEFQKAVEHWDAALAFENSDFPVRHIEIRTNLRVRAAFLRWRKTLEKEGATSPALAAEKVAAAAEIDRAIREVDRLQLLGKSAERWSLLGSAYKRLAAIEDAWPARRKHLKAMDEAYVKARDAARDAGLKVVYPYYNVAFSGYLLDLLGMPSGTGRPELEAVIDHAVEIAGQEETDSPSLFSRVSVAELEMLKELRSEKLPGAQEICESYANAWRRGGSVRAIRSISENLFCAQRILRPAGGPRGSARRPEVATLLAEIEEKLQALMRKQGIDPEAKPGDAGESTRDPNAGAAS